MRRRLPGRGTKDMARQTALKRLQSLPAIFRVQELPRLTEWSPGTAAVMLHRWSKAGMVTRTGPRGDVVQNRYADEQTYVNRERVAIARAWPGAIEIGAGPIREAGWTTQIPRLMDLAVPGKGWLAPAPGGVLRHHRPVSWYTVVQANLVVDGSSAGLPSLEPTWALADAVLDTRLWAPDPDELYLDENNSSDQWRFLTAITAIATARKLGFGDAVARLDRNDDFDRLYERVWLARRGRPARKAG